MNEIKFLKAYVLYVLVGFIAGAIIGAIQGFILGLILGIAGYPIEKIPIITGTTGFCFGVIISFFVFRWSIQKFILTQLDETQQIEREPVTLINDPNMPLSDLHVHRKNK